MRSRKPRMPPGFWSIKSNHRVFLDDLANKLQLKNFEGWYGVTTGDLNNHGGHRLLALHNGSFSKLLQAVYPEYLSHSLIYSSTSYSHT